MESLRISDDELHQSLEHSTCRVVALSPALQLKKMKSLHISNEELRDLFEHPTSKVFELSPHAVPSSVLGAPPAKKRPQHDRSSTLVSNQSKKMKSLQVTDKELRKSLEHATGKVLAPSPDTVSSSTRETPAAKKQPYHDLLMLEVPISKRERHDSFFNHQAQALISQKHCLLYAKDQDWKHISAIEDDEAETMGYSCEEWHARFGKYANKTKWNEFACHEERVRVMSRKRQYQERWAKLSWRRKEATRALEREVEEECVAEPSKAFQFRQATETPKVYGDIWECPTFLKEAPR